jgi:putative ABC transport system permease protein
MLETLWQDVRYALRILVKKPVFTLAAVITLGLGIGANTAIFSVVNAVLLRPLPFDEPDQILQVWSTNKEDGENDLVVSVPDFVDWQAQNRSFEQLAAYSLTSFILTNSQEPERLRGAKVSASFFPLLRVTPALGSVFTAEDDRFGSERVAIVSFGLWQRRFSSNPQIVGEQIRLSNQTYRIVGVMPESFNFPVRKLGGTDIWVPHAFNPNASMSKRSSSYLAVIGRLKKEVAPEQAQADMNIIAGNLAQQFPASNQHRGVHLVSLHEQMVEKVRTMVLILFAVVSSVVLIACINVATLLLARSSTRHKEMIIRSAVGATRTRLIRQSLTESVLVALLGGGLGLLFAAGGLKFLVSLIPPEISQLSAIGLDKTVFVWTFVLSILTGLLFGLAPAMEFAKPAMIESLKESAAGATAGLKRTRLRSFLIAGEVALSVIVLVCAGLLLRSLWRLQSVPTGFSTENVLTLTLSLPQYSYPDSQKQSAFHAQVLERLQNLAGVKSAGITTILPLSGISEAGDFQVVGRDMGKATPSVNSRAISPDYLRTLGISLLRGRSLTKEDNQNATPVCLINDWMAREVFVGEEPLGKRINTAGAEREIVGIVGDVKHRALNSKPDFEMYVPYTQYQFVSSMTYTLRTDVDPTSLVPSIRAAIAEMDPQQTIDNVQTMDQVLLKSIAQPRFNTFLLSLFAGVALLIASVGLYGTLSFMVAQRTHEIGVRMAVGAQMIDVLKLIVSHGMKVTLIGVVVGTIGAFAAARILAGSISGFLFEVSATDLLTFIAAPVLLILVALVACCAAAVPATKVDPLVALRYE